MTTETTQTTGRRKEAVARVRLRPGTGTITINGRALDNYFTSATHRQMLTQPLRDTNTEVAYDVDATIAGGGMAGQAGALRLGIARALIEVDAELREQIDLAEAFGQGEFVLCDAVGVEAAG